MAAINITFVTWAREGRIALPFATARRFGMLAQPLRVGLLDGIV